MEFREHVKASDLIGEQINDGSATFEIVSFDNARMQFWCVELIYNEDTDQDEKANNEFCLTKKEMEIALHHFDGKSHVISFEQKGEKMMDKYKYSVEIVKNDVLDETSAVYFNSIEKMLDFCKNRLMDDNERFYVTLFGGEYSENLTNKANKLIK